MTDKRLDGDPKGTRWERVAFLLSHWRDYEETLVKSQGVRGEVGDGGHLMPTMSRHPAVVELKRCLALYAMLAPTRYGHLKAFYQAEWRIATKKVKRRTKKGKSETVDIRSRERIGLEKIRLEKVRSGVTYITLIYGHGDKAMCREPFIPDEFLTDKKFLKRAA